MQLFCCRMTNVFFVAIVSFHEIQLLYLLPVVAKHRIKIKELDLFHPTLSVRLDNNQEVQEVPLHKVKDINLRN